MGRDCLVRRCLGEGGLSDQGRANIVVGLRRLRIDGENTLKLVDRLVEPALPLQRETKLDVRLRVAPVQVDGLAVHLLGVRELALVERGVAFEEIGPLDIDVGGLEARDDFLSLQKALLPVLAIQHERVHGRLHLLHDGGGSLSHQCVGVVGIEPAAIDLLAVYSDAQRVFVAKEDFARYRRPAP